MHQSSRVKVKQEKLLINKLKIKSLLISIPRKDLYKT